MADGYVGGDPTRGRQLREAQQEQEESWPLLADQIVSFHFIEYSRNKLNGMRVVSKIMLASRAVYMSGCD